jgi:hypothetical protein
MPSDIQLKTAQCNDAFQAYAALRRAALDDTALLTNPYYTALVDTAHARFLALFSAWDGN